MAPLMAKERVGGGGVKTAPRPLQTPEEPIGRDDNSVAKYVEGHSMARARIGNKSGNKTLNGLKYCNQVIDCRQETYVCRLGVLESS